MLTAKGQFNETRGQENNSITVTVLVTKYETEEVWGRGAKWTLQYIVKGQSLRA